MWLKRTRACMSASCRALSSLRPGMRFPVAVIVGCAQHSQLPAVDEGFCDILTTVANNFQARHAAACHQPKTRRGTKRRAPPAFFGGGFEVIVHPVERNASYRRSASSVAWNAMPVRARRAVRPFRARKGVMERETWIGSRVAPILHPGLRRQKGLVRPVGASCRPISLFNDVELGLVTKPSASDTMDHTPVFRPMPASRSQQGRD